MIYLYLKTHNVTGKKYLGKTVQNPHKYMGSGKYWKLHLEKHGHDVSTEVLLESKSKDEICKAGIEYSKMWDIVSSEEFANLKAEEGDGGAQVWTEEQRKRQSQAQIKRWKYYDSTERDKKISRTLKGRVIGCNKKKSIAAKNRKSHPWTGKKRHTKICPHCGKEGADFLMTRWHFDNCKLNSSKVS